MGKLFTLAFLPIIIVRMVFILGALFLLTGAIPFIVEGCNNEPTVENAPWAVQTYSYVNGKSIPMRAYYAEEYSVIDNTPSIAGYWYYDGRRYRYHRDILKFPQDKWGPITVIRRTQ